MLAMGTQRFYPFPGPGERELELTEQRARLDKAALSTLVPCVEGWQHNP